MAIVTVSPPRLCGSNFSILVNQRVSAQRTRGRRRVRLRSIDRSVMAIRGQPKPQLCDEGCGSLFTTSSEGKVPLW